MASDYKNYLATNILNEDRVITYRLLSRALKVHVNAAKEMLYEFHRLQNGKKPGSVYATYLVAGRKHAEAPAVTVSNKKDRGDEFMQSSPFQSSPIPRPDGPLEDTSVFSITLMREEDLEDIQSHYDIISSIHIFSLGSYRSKDLQVLSDATRETSEMCSSQDPLQLMGTYGTVANKGVKRRTGRKPPIPASTTTVPSKPSATLSTSFDGKKDQNIPSKPPDSKTTKDPSQLTGEPSVRGTKDARTINSKTPQLKRDNSNIFKSFAKATPKLKREDTEGSGAGSDTATAAHGGQVDVQMNTSDDEDDYVVPSQPPNGSTEDSRQTRKEREAALKKMMEDSDSGEDSQVIPEKEASPRGNHPDQPTEEAVQISDGRRRGRRRVMKKKTFEDEEGYFVTKEESVWESFSEDELVQKPKAKPLSAAKAKKVSSKPGQGSIMSFFGKK